MTRKWTKSTNTFCLVSTKELEVLKALNKNSIYAWNLEVLMEEWVIDSINRVITKFQYAQKLRLISWKMKWKESEIYDGVEMLEHLKNEFNSIEKKLEEYTEEMSKKSLSKDKK